MSDYIEIDPGQDGNDEDWNAISDFVTHLAQSDRELDHELESENIPEQQAQSAQEKTSEQPEIQNSENYAYLIDNFGKTDNNFQYIRKEIHELLNELGEIRAARAGLQERLHNLNL